MVYAATGYVSDPSAHLALTCINRMSCANVTRELKPLGMDVDRNNWRSANNATRHYCAQADRADTEYRETFAGPNIERIHYRSSARLNTTAQRCEVL